MLGPFLVLGCAPQSGRLAKNDSRQSGRRVAPAKCGYLGNDIRFDKSAEQSNRGDIHRKWRCVSFPFWSWGRFATGRIFVSGDRSGANFFAFKVFSQSAFPPPSMPPPPQLEYFYGNQGIMVQVVHVPLAPAVSHLFYFQKMKSLTYNSLKAPICTP